jgi:DnaJ-class molecular chaperone
LTVPAGSSSGSKLRLKGLGVKAGDGPPGDLMAELEVHMPANLSDADRDQLAAIADKYHDDPRADLKW